MAEGAVRLEGGNRMSIDRLSRDRLLDGAAQEPHIIHPANNCLLNLSLPLRIAPGACIDPTDVSPTSTWTGTRFFCPENDIEEAMLKISADEIHFIIY